MSTFQNVTLLDINEILFSAKVRICLTCRKENIRVDQNDIMALDAMTVDNPNAYDRLGYGVQVIKGIDREGRNFAAARGEHNAERWEGHWLLLRSA